MLEAFIILTGLFISLYNTVFWFAKVSIFFESAILTA